jgi:hypothetical protein
VAVYADSDSISAISTILPNGRFVVGMTTGEVRFLELVNMPLQAPQVTAVRLWHFGEDGQDGAWDEQITAACPSCTARFPVPYDALDAIAHAARSASISLYDAPCLALADESWDEPGLQASCPACGQPLRFNPFVVDRHGEYWQDRSALTSARSLRRHRSAAADTHSAGRTCCVCSGACGEPGLPLADDRLLGKNCLITLAETREPWQTGTDLSPCLVCLKSKATHVLQTSLGAVCDRCLLDGLEAIANVEDVQAWTVSKLRSALVPSGALMARLTVLWRFNEVWKKIREQRRTTRSGLLTDLVRNLGMVDHHLCSARIRQLALDACILVGPELVPILLQSDCRHPWQLYVNVLKAMATIAPEHDGFREMAETAADDPRPEVRGRLPAVISDYDAPWARSLLVGLRDDPDVSVCQEADKVLAAWSGAKT